MDEDRASTSPGPATPASQPAAKDAAAGEPPGLRTQIGSTFAAGKRLFTAHVNLAKEEAAEIVGEVKRMVALGAAAIGIVLLAALLLFIGGILFLGEWLFGSIGWGVLLGFLLLLDIALVMLLAALDVSGKRIGTSFLIAAGVGAALALVLAFDVLHQGWRALGDSIATSAIADEPTRTTVVAVVGLALVAGIIGFAGGIRGGLKPAVGSLIGAAVVGALLGWVTASPPSGQGGAAIGVLVALTLWPILAGLDVARQGIDGEALAAKFKPTQTMNLTKETIEWVRARTPLVPKS